MTSVDLAKKIALYIVRENGCSYTDIERRAESKGIDRQILLAALTIVHRNKTIKVTNAGGDIHYALAPQKKIESPFMRFDDYPAMDATNDAHHEVFAGLDYSYLFLKPEEMLAFKAGLKGKTYVSKKVIALDTDCFLSSTRFVSLKS